MIMLVWEIFLAESDFCEQLGFKWMVCAAVVDRQLLPQYMMAMFYKRYFKMGEMTCIILVKFIYLSYALVIEIWNNQRIHVVMSGCCIFSCWWRISYWLFVKKFGEQRYQGTVLITLILYHYLVVSNCWNVPSIMLTDNAKILLQEKGNTTRRISGILPLNCSFYKILEIFWSCGICSIKNT